MYGRYEVHELGPEDNYLHALLYICDECIYSLTLRADTVQLERRVKNFSLFILSSLSDVM